jgi:hypothetical protein
MSARPWSTAVFRRLRQRWGIDAGDFMLSLCGDQALRELSSPGKSGSVGRCKWKAVEPVFENAWFQSFFSPTYIKPPSLK